MRKLMATILLALALAITLAAGGARFGAFSAHATGPGQPVLADQCGGGASTPC